MPISKNDYRAWAEFRYHLRLWLRLSEDAAREAGVPPQHHQALLAIKGFPGNAPPLITDLAERLQLKHHSVVGLVDRLVSSGLVERHETGVGRSVAILMTEDGEAVLEGISMQLRPELRRAADDLITSLAPLTGPARARSTASRSAASRSTAGTSATTTRRTAGRNGAVPAAPRARRRTSA